MEVKKYFQKKAKLTNSCNLACGKCRLYYINNGRGLRCDMFELKHPEEAEKIVSEWWEDVNTLQLSLTQIKAIEGRIAEGYVYAAKDPTGDVWFYTTPPVLVGSVFTAGEGGLYSKSHSNIYSFITTKDSPVHLPTLLRTIERGV